MRFSSVVLSLGVGVSVIGTIVPPVLFNSSHGPLLATIPFVTRQAQNEPTTGVDFPDTPPHPNELDKIETAFHDAMELVAYVMTYIDSDTTIFRNYFDGRNKAGVKRVFSAIYNNGKGSEKLNDILIQKPSPTESCKGTLAFMMHGERGSGSAPYIVLCPAAFNKKAVTQLNGAAVGDDRFYARCPNVGDYVSVKFNTLGMTLLHEYMHFDEIANSQYGAIIDYGDPSAPDNEKGYGPYNVYGKLKKSLARTNADSYAYYASEQHIFWKTVCQLEFKAPRPGVNDEDPDI